MNVFIQLRDEDKKLFFLKSYTPITKDKGSAVDFVWTDDKKSAHNFKSFENTDFQALLDMFAEHHHLANITYITMKK